MSKSKTNKSHKERVNKFKNQQKSNRMSEEIKVPESPIAQQYPVWSSKENMEVSGLEFEAIYNFLNMFRNAVMAGESVLQKNINNGKIKWVYKDKDGKDVPSVEVEKYQKAIETFFEAQKGQAPAEKNDQEGVPFIDGIVGPDGKPLPNS